MSYHSEVRLRESAPRHAGPDSHKFDGLFDPPIPVVEGFQMSGGMPTPEKRSRNVHSKLGWYCNLRGRLLLVGDGRKIEWLMGFQCKIEIEQCPYSIDSQGCTAKAQSFVNNNLSLMCSCLSYWSTSLLPFYLAILEVFWLKCYYIIYRINELYIRND